MNDFKKIKKAINLDWYVQGFNAVPLFLGPSAISGINMRHDLGFGYHGFLFHYRDGYGEMAYLNTDIAAIWQKIKILLKRDKNYLVKVKRLYDKKISEAEAFQVKISKTVLHRLSEDELMDFFRHSVQAQIDTVGVGHLVEIISVAAEKEFKSMLLRSIGVQPDFNEIYNLLTTPAEASFIGQQETALQRIARLPRSLRKKNLAVHLKKYFWIQNSYSGPKKLTINDFMRRLEAVRSIKLVNPGSVRRKKLRLLARLKISRSLREFINLIEFTTIWQDSRKANILRNVSYLALVARELARRSDLTVEQIYQLGVNESLSVRSIKALKSISPLLRQRQLGMLILMEKDGEYKVSGQQYRKLLPLIRAVEQRSAADGSSIHGSVANGGTAVGRVTVCRNIASLSKVGQGDVIVASMTRPEFLPALKKASAIVTDEGGITCHAAIVARELGLPCVIGTKIATKVLKDGMIVEVRANHGLIKIVK
jgi:phosphohistidine swiveling domain-containing protein